jgi:hypothetical protein
MIGSVKLCEKIEILYRRVQRYSWSKRLRSKYCLQLIKLERAFEKSFLKESINWIKNCWSESGSEPIVLPVIEHQTEWMPKIGLRVKAIFDGRQGKIVKIFNVNQANIGLSEIRVEYDDKTFDTPYPNQLIPLEYSPIEPPQASPKKEMTNPVPPAPAIVEVPKAPIPAIAEVPEAPAPELDWDVARHREVELNGRKGIIVKIVEQTHPRSPDSLVTVKFSNDYTSVDCLASKLTKRDPAGYIKREPVKPQILSTDFPADTEIHKVLVAKEEIIARNNILMPPNTYTSARAKCKYAKERQELNEEVNRATTIAGYYSRLEEFASNPRKGFEYAPSVVVTKIRTITRGMFFTFLVGENQDILFQTSFVSERDRIMDQLRAVEVQVIFENEGEGYADLEDFIRNPQKGFEFMPIILATRMTTLAGINYFRFSIGQSDASIFQTSFISERDRVIRRMMRANISVIVVEGEGERYRAKMVSNDKIELKRIPVGRPKTA